MNRMRMGAHGKGQGRSDESEVTAFVQEKLPKDRPHLRTMSREKEKLRCYLELRMGSKGYFSN